jgi:hypothetical protein
MAILNPNSGEKDFILFEMPCRHRLKYVRSLKESRNTDMGYALVIHLICLIPPPQSPPFVGS